MVAGLSSCILPTDARRNMPAQSVVLLVTPKVIPDFASPEAAIAQFFAHYEPLTSHAAEVIVVFGVGNSDHILEYRGMDHWSDQVEWARLTDSIPVSTRVLDYNLIRGIVLEFKEHAVAKGIKLKVYDFIDSGSEFTPTSNFKYVRHVECVFTNRWGSYDVGARLLADDRSFASAPDGIAEGTLCGEFLADQVAAYMHDLGFDGILYKNQLGTRGRWHPGEGPGYSESEANAIRSFLEYSQRTFGDKDLMWFDSYNNVSVEQETFSFPADAYGSFDYLIASGFCVITTSERYLDNLTSKLRLRKPPRILATLDYVDPWYTYNSMTDYPEESAKLEQIAIDYRYSIDGIMLFANDERGALVPRELIVSFAERFLSAR